MKVLITHPEFDNPGGVSNYYKRLQNKFEIPIVHFIVGKRIKEKNFLSRILRVFLDYFRFVKCLKRINIDLVHINPSLDLKSFIRDGIFALLAKINKRKTVIFFRGWKKSFEAHIKSDAFIVLSDEFRKTLKRWGVVQPIHQEVTIVDEDDLRGFDIKKALRKRQRSKKWSVLFLSRVTRNKGIYETIEAVSLLRSKFPMIELIVAGDGDELEDVKSFVHNRNISNVKFVGYIRNEKKRRIFEKAQVFLFPSYSEGMPLSVVEAISFGLPVVTRPVGGLADFFKNKKHGFITESKEPIILANYIEKLFLDKGLYENISFYNFNQGKKWFLASKAAKRLEEIYSEVLF
ncbi:MAG: glycosyltransferase family 4 protein [Candidatus Hodarchaeales archaeon]|jgi:glycosyltransferase involved in cell wall biosynthesis